MPYRFLFPAIMAFCCIGLYTLNNNNFDVFMAAGFGVVGYVFYKLGCEPAPLLLGFILGPMMEENLRRALLLSRGDWTHLHHAAAVGRPAGRRGADDRRGHAAVDQEQARGGLPGRGLTSERLLAGRTLRDGAPDPRRAVVHARAGLPSDAPCAAAPGARSQGPVFRGLWFAWLAANLTMWMNDVAAAWLMTTLTTSPVMVALVQTAQHAAGVPARPAQRRAGRHRRPAALLRRHAAVGVGERAAAGRRCRWPGC